MKRVLVTGAAGNIGGEVVRALVRRGIPVSAADRRPDRVAAAFGAEVALVRFDFRDEGSWRQALEGIDHVFLVRPPAIADVEKTLNPFVDFARANGVEHFVFLSVAGAEKNRFVPHRKVEDHLRESGAHFTNLRPGFFAQNLEMAYREDIVSDDRIYVPAGKHPVNWIDGRDIAEIAAVIFESPKAHRGESYTLTGPGPVPWSEVTDALTLATGRTIRYEPASVIGYMRHLGRRGTPRGAIIVQTILHFFLRFGQGATFDFAVERLLGRPGRSVREYIFDRASQWSKDQKTPTASAD